MRAWRDQPWWQKELYESGLRSEFLNEKHSDLSPIEQLAELGVTVRTV